MLRSFVALFPRRVLIAAIEIAGFAAVVVAAWIYATALGLLALGLTLVLIANALSGDRSERPGT